MVLDNSKANDIKRKQSNSSDTSESSTNQEKVLLPNKLCFQEPLDAHLDCDLALITEEVVDGTLSSWYTLS